MLNAEPLRDAAEMLLNGQGPDFEAGMDERYADWLLDLADRYYDITGNAPDPAGPKEGRWMPEAVIA